MFRVTLINKSNLTRQCNKKFNLFKIKLVNKRDEALGQTDF